MAKYIDKDAIVMERETAMKILKELHGKSLFAERTALETLIPEIKESKDETIRKEIIEFVDINTLSVDERHDRWIAWLEKQGYTKKDVDDAYLKGISDAKNELEKQGEQKPSEVRTTGYWNVKDIDQKPFDYEHATITQKDFASVGETATIELSSPIDCGDRIYHVSHKPIEKQCEQKTAAWSDEDEENLQHCCMAISVDSLHTYEDKQDMEAWLKSLKNRIGG